jgi:hypothetical protein
MSSIPRRVMLLAPLFVVAACASTLSVSSHVDRNTSFAGYHTYGWGPADALPTGDPRLDRNPLFQDEFQGAVEKQLATKGLTRSELKPDLLIHYHANITERLDVNGIDRGRGYCGDLDCGGVVGSHEAGTLVLDVVDARTNRLIWRGWVQGPAKKLLDDPGEMARQIRSAVPRMMAPFPNAY